VLDALSLDDVELDFASGLACDSDFESDFDFTSDFAFESDFDSASDFDFDSDFDSEFDSDFESDFDDGSLEAPSAGPPPFPAFPESFFA
jgi:hypothetical protein